MSFCEVKFHLKYQEQAATMTWGTPLQARLDIFLQTNTPVTASNIIFWSGMSYNHDLRSVVILAESTKSYFFIPPGASRSLRHWIQQCSRSSTVDELPCSTLTVDNFIMNSKIYNVIHISMNTLFHTYSELHPQNFFAPITNLISPRSPRPKSHKFPQISRTRSCH